MRMMIENDHAGTEARRLHFERLALAMRDPANAEITERVRASAAAKSNLTHHQERVLESVMVALFGKI